MLNNMKIGTKLALGFGLLIVLLLAIGMIGWLGVTQMNGSVKIAQYFGLISDDSNQTIISGTRAMKASAIFFYTHDEKTAQLVQEQINDATEKLNQILEQIKNDTFYSDEWHQQYITHVNDTLKTVTEFGEINRRFSELQKIRNEKNRAFQEKYLQSGVVLGEILNNINTPYKERL
ncbi:MAG: MCP four helix bundle domain-containing protein, partial [Planctomycetaceae bacterium]|nr:MCP four helix bundle domain-containing protein [Planctomycetaceae bacterium]